MKTRRNLLAELGARNPFYVGSALLVLAGVYLALGPERFFRANQTLLLAGVLEVYQLLVLATAAWIVRRHGLRFDALSLMAVEGVLLFDAPLFHTSLGAVSPGLGMALSTSALVLAMLKVLAFLHFSGLGFGVLREYAGPFLSVFLFLSLVHLGPAPVARWAHASHVELPWIGPQALVVVFALGFLPGLFGRGSASAEGIGRWIRGAATILAPTAVALHLGAWAFVFRRGDNPPGLVFAFLVVALLVTVGPLLYIAGQALVRGGAGDAAPAVNLPWTALVFAGVLAFFSPEPLLPDDFFGLTLVRLSALCGAVAFLAMRRTHPDALRFPHAAWLLCAGWFFGGPLEILPHGIIALGLLHVALALTLIRHKSSLAAIGAAAVSAAVCTFLFSKSGTLHLTDTEPWFAIAQFAVIAAMGFSLIVPLGHIILTFLMTVALTAGFFEIVRVPGLPVEAAFLLLAATATSAGVRWREWPALMAGILGTGAEGVFQGWPLIPKDARGMGILLLAGGFLLFAAGFVVTLLMNRRALAAVVLGTGEEGEFPHEDPGARPD
ncbi:MAG: hypothetical protein ACYS47_09835 [Planctomycetota bacterium]|jgi:hypothetical protein